MGRLVGSHQGCPYTARMSNAPNAVQDLLAYIDASPTPYHCVAETARRLDAAGYSRLDEDQTWKAAPGDKHYVIRGGGSIVAFQRGSGDPADEGFQVVGAHTDSPNLRVKPNADLAGEGYRRIALEPYGGVLTHTWFDRDLSLAGRVGVRTPQGGTRMVLVDLERALLRVANLAIHLQRELMTDGFKPNHQQHVHGLLGMDDAPSLATLLAEAIGDVAPGDVLSYDLMVYDLQPSIVSGAGGDFIHAPRLDNQGSCHAGLSALLAGADAPASFTRVLALWDHEEIGSRTAHGADGPLLRDVLARLTDGENELRRALAKSLLISADMAHAVHPNYPDRHEPAHRPVLGRGPVIKSNINQRYASEAESIARFMNCCERAGVTPQQFANRADLACGSTIGPATAAALGVRTVDVGNPMLSMHSAREMAGAADVPMMIDVMKAFYEVL